MFAVIKTGGKQYLVKDDQLVVIEKTSDGAVPRFETLLFFDGKKLSVGNPTTESPLKLEIVADTKGPKIKILKHRAKKHSRTRKGHRQKLVKVKVYFGNKPAEKTPVTKAPVAKAPVAKTSAKKKTAVKKPSAKKLKS